MSAKKIKLFGAQADTLEVIANSHDSLQLTDENPDVVVCYGGDGTLLSAEARWPGVPKVAIRNSRRGHRMMAERAEAVLERLAKDELAAHEYMKLDCTVKFADEHLAPCSETVMNECNVHMAHINSSVRFELWTNDEPYEDGLEIVGDGFVVCTPFGSTAYFNQITRGVFSQGVGVAFKYTSEHTHHLVLPVDTVIRVRITRGPAVLAFDNKAEHVDLTADDELIVKRHPHPAILLR